MRNWDLSIGLYQGLLIGMRTYGGQIGGKTSHVFYLPLVDLCINIYHERTDITGNEKQD